MKHYGIIGTPLGHSWSAQYFSEKFTKEHIDAEYRLYECSTLEEVVQTIRQLDGCNITIPYKKAILPYLTDLDPVAAQIGAVNVVKGDKGYNTDWIGFVKSLQPMLNANDRQALVFGTGGAAQAVAYGLRQLNITYRLISRPDYQNLNQEDIQQTNLLINCTPLGMWPRIDDCVPIPYNAITSAHLLFDCVYNPEETLFLQKGHQQGARTKNGLDMLHIQADEALKIWNENIKTQTI